MPPKRKSGGKKVQLYDAHGRGFFGDLWSGLKKGFNFVKDNKLVSGVASLIPHPLAQRVAAGAKMVGMGKRKKGGHGVGKITI